LSRSHFNLYHSGHVPDEPDKRVEPAGPGILDVLLISFASPFLAPSPLALARLYDAEPQSYGPTQSSTSTAIVPSTTVVYRPWTVEPITASGLAHVMLHTHLSLPSPLSPALVAFSPFQETGNLLCPQSLVCYHDMTSSDGIIDPGQSMLRAPMCRLWLQPRHPYTRQSRDTVRNVAPVNVVGEANRRRPVTFGGGLAAASGNASPNPANASAVGGSGGADKKGSDDSKGDRHGHRDVYDARDRTTPPWQLSLQCYLVKPGARARVDRPLLRALLSGAAAQLSALSHLVWPEPTAAVTLAPGASVAMAASSSSTTVSALGLCPLAPIVPSTSDTSTPSLSSLSNKSGMSGMMNGAPSTPQGTTSTYAQPPPESAPSALILPLHVAITTRMALLIESLYQPLLQ
jgi:hypothetical protein